MTKKWICYHIYYQDDFRVLLKDLVIPVCNLLRNHNFFTDFFYLCYWKNGPHLRLRMKVDNILPERVNEIVESVADKYLRENPSKDVVSPLLYEELATKFSIFEGEQLSDFKLEVNNTFKKEVYNPEFKKYGGEIGIRIAEDIFVKSSQLIFNYFEKDIIPRKKIYLTALMAMFVAVKAFRFNIKEICDFFYSYYQYWLSFSDDLKKIDTIGSEYQSSKRFFIDMFVTIYESQAISNVLLNNWYVALDTACRQIDTNIVEIINSLDSNIPENRLKSHLLTHFIHTHNNRFCVFASEEASLGYLAYLVTRDYMYSVV